MFRILIWGFNKIFIWVDSDGFLQIEVTRKRSKILLHGT